MIILADIFHQKAKSSVSKHALALWYYSLQRRNQTLELMGWGQFVLVLREMPGASFQELIEYHSYNAGGLACRLKSPPGRSKPPTAGLSHGKWEIDPTELTLLEELGSGERE